MLARRAQLPAAFTQGTDCESGLCKSGICMLAAASGSWTSGTNQAPGMWFELDMVEPQIFLSIVLENTGDQSGVSQDAPLLFDVYLSLDGEENPPVKQGLVGARETLISFESAQYARQVRFELQGTKEKWWSIHDLRVLEWQKGPMDSAGCGP